MLRASALPLGSTPGSCLPDSSSACQQSSCPSDQHTPAPAALAGPSYMDAGHSCLQWQAADSVDHPPSNNLAGVTAHHTHSLPPTPADSAWADLAGPTAAAAAAGLADGRDVCDSDGLGAAALSGPALSSQVLGEQLVGCQVETRSQLDTSWFTATVEAFDPVSQLHLLRFEDGELETLDLSAEQWKLASTNSSGMHTPTLTAAAAAAGQVQLAVDSDTDGGTGPSDEATWWAAVEQSLSEQPLQMVLDSLTGRFKVLHGSEVLQAELAMRQQQQLKQQQQQQPQHGHHQQLQQQWEEEEEEDQAAATAEWWQGQQGGGFMLGSSLNNIGSSSGSHLLQASAATGAAGLAPAAHDAFDLAAAAAAAAAEAAAASHATPFAAAGEAASVHVAAGRGVESASAVSKRRRLLCNSSAVAPAGAHMPSQPHSLMPAPLTNAATPAAGVQDVPGPDTAVDVVCNDSKQGTYLINANVVVCGCDTCLQQQMRTGVVRSWKPAEFERHAGMGSSRKWRNSIKVVLADTKKHMSLGTWLAHFEQHRLRQHLTSHQPPPPQQQHQQWQWQQRGEEEEEGLMQWEPQPQKQPQQQLLMQPQGADGGQAVAGCSDGLEGVLDMQALSDTLLQQQPQFGQQEQQFWQQQFGLQEQLSSFPMVSAAGFGSPSAQAGYMHVFPAVSTAAGGVEYSSSIAGLAFGPMHAFFGACDSIPVMPGTSNTEQCAGPQPPALQGLLHCWQLGGPLGGVGGGVGDSGGSGGSGGGGDGGELPAGLCGWASAGQGAGGLGQRPCGDWWAAGNDADGGLLC